MKVGDKVYLVYDDSRRSPFYVTIRSIGNKYITIDGVHRSESRYDITTKCSVDDSRGWNCKARLYESKEKYFEQQLESMVIRELINRIVYCLNHKPIKPKTLHSIARLLGIETEIL